MLRFLSLALAVSLLSSCHPRQNDNNYARRAFHEQRIEREGTGTHARLDQASPMSDVIDIDQFEKDSFPQLPWETIDQWIERLQKQLLLDHNTIVRLSEEVSNISSKEEGLIKQLQLVIAMNEQLRSRVSELEVVDPMLQKDQKMFTTLPPATFKVHLVKRGDTLYSIAREYYSDPGMVREILLWNQGWIRDPNQMTAGLALILFTEGSDERNEQVVENYVGQWMAIQ